MWERIQETLPLVEEAGFQNTSFLGVSLHFRVNHCMADGGSVVITPDGGLYPCEHCPEVSRFGDVFQGVTNEEAWKAFGRADTTREKCRTCPFLPDCTSFASCPVQDTHCKEVRLLIARDVLRRLVDQKEKETNEEEDPAC